MTGITDLKELIRSMEPKRLQGEYIFSTVKDVEAKYPSAIFTFKEEEGLTVVLRKEEADNLGLTYSGTWAMITLTVHSSLEAVGFLAAITKKLAEKEISMNVVSAYYHDHLFVPTDRADDAMAALKELSEA